MGFKIGRILVILSLSLLFLAYSNFAPTALQSDTVAGYVKNHFVREIIFGLTLGKVEKIISQLGQSIFLLRNSKKACIMDYGRLF